MDDKELTYINMTDIIPNASQPRSTFVEKSLVELADSIRAHGVLEPILVVRAGTYFKVIAGERRYRAAKIAGLTRIPALIIRKSEQELLEIAIIENLQRQNLNPIEEALAIRSLIENYNLTQEQAAAALGRSRPAICNLLRILSLPPKVQELVRQGKLSQGHARALLALNDPAKIETMAERCIRNKDSVHALTQQIQQLNQRKAAKPTTAKRPQLSLEFTALVNDMEHVFQMPIKVTGDNRKGTIALQYEGQADLNRLYDLVQQLLTPQSD